MIHDNIRRTYDYIIISILHIIDGSFIGLTDLRDIGIGVRMTRNSIVIITFLILFLTSCYISLSYIELKGKIKVYEPSISSLFKEYDGVKINVTSFVEPLREGEVTFSTLLIFMTMDPTSVEKVVLSYDESPFNLTGLEDVVSTTFSKYRDEIFQPIYTKLLIGGLEAEEGHSGTLVNTSIELDIEVYYRDRSAHTDKLLIDDVSLPILIGEGNVPLFIGLGIASSIISLFFLPLSLIFIYRYRRKRHRKYVIASLMLLLMVILSISISYAQIGYTEYDEWYKEPFMLRYSVIDLPQGSTTFENLTPLYRVYIWNDDGSIGFLQLNMNNNIFVLKTYSYQDLTSGFEYIIPDISDRKKIDLGSGAEATGHVGYFYLNALRPGIKYSGGDLVEAIYDSKLGLLYRSIVIEGNSSIVTFLDTHIGFTPSVYLSHYLKIYATPPIVSTTLTLIYLSLKRRKGGVRK